MTTPGWYKDRDSDALARWHDGTGWTEHTMVMADWAGPGSPPPPQDRVPAFSAPPPPPAAAAPTRQAARADAAAAQARSKAMRPWFKKKRIMLPLGLVVLVVIIAAASGGGNKKDNVTASNTTTPGQTTVTTVKSVNSGSHPAADDVTITDCENQGYGAVKVGVQVINHTTKTSNYLVEIGVNDSAGTKVGDGGASTNSLAPGQTATIDGYGTASSSTKGAVTCVVTSVTRYAS
jgi:hypothetical protein